MHFVAHRERDRGGTERAKPGNLREVQSVRTELQLRTPAPLVRPANISWRKAEWQQLWLSVQTHKRRWRSLALVPAGVGAPPELTQQIAVTLAHTGMAHLGSPVHVADATHVQLEHLMQFSEEMQRYGAEGCPILVALPPLAESVTALPLAQGTDAALLCVALDHMRSADAKATLARIGSQRFIGAAVFRSSRD